MSRRGQNGRLAMQARILNEKTATREEQPPTKIRIEWSITKLNKQNCCQQQQRSDVMYTSQQNNSTSRWSHHRIIAACRMINQTTSDARAAAAEHSHRCARQKHQKSNCCQQRRSDWRLDDADRERKSSQQDTYHKTTIASLYHCRMMFLLCLLDWW